MLGEVEVGVRSGYRYEPREPSLKLMLPLLLESKASVPRNCAGGIVHSQNRATRRPTPWFTYT